MQTLKTKHHFSVLLLSLSILLYAPELIALPACNGLREILQFLSDSGQYKVLREEKTDYPAQDSLLRKTESNAIAAMIKCKVSLVNEERVSDVLHLALENAIQHGRTEGAFPGISLTSLKIQLTFRIQKRLIPFLSIGVIFLLRRHQPIF